MSAEKFLKITYHGAAANKGMKLNAYLKMPSPTFAVLLREIALCLFDQRKQPRTELRTYWIDDDGDEIDIVDQCDYEIFMNKRADRRHLQVAPIIEGGANGNENTNAAGTSADGTNVDPSSFVIHERVECDGCSNAPIIGFRYKCIQCPNYDLCERCEAQHKHSEHMMVRMPNDNCPSVVEAFVTGRSGRRHKRNMSSTCPFVAGTPPMNFCGTPPTTTGPAATTAGGTPCEGGKDHHGRHGRKHHRRHMQNGIFAHLYNMMQDLAEGGGPVGEAAEAEATKAANVAAHEAATAVANAAHIAAHEAAVAASKAATTAAAALNNAAETLEQQKSDSTSTAPKTPPPTPIESGTSTEEATLKKTNETNTTNTAPQPKQTTTPEGVPVLGSPILENVAQFVDPQYMKAGIQILNNFSEMFAKMLDPMDGSIGNAGPQCPFQTAAFPQQSRKSSMSSSTSSNMSTSNTGTTTVPTEKPTEQTPLLEEASASSQQKPTPLPAFIPAPASENETFPLITTADSTATPTPERRRSLSEENDWHIIENQTLPPLVFANTPTDSLNNAATTASIPSYPVDVTPKADAATATAAAATTAQQTQTVRIDYEQLSKDLRTHIAEEQQREEQAKLLATAPTLSPTATPVSAAAAAALAREEEKRTTPIYHRDPKINKAVLSMMAMGFSNEGAWLTQLLESVNGSIPQALDVMSAAQRNAQ